MPQSIPTVVRRKSDKFFGRTPFGNVFAVDRKYDLLETREPADDRLVQGARRAEEDSSVD
jgi:hypothetical protein